MFTKIKFPIRFIWLSLMILAVSSQILAVPPHPEMLEKAAKTSKAVPYYLANHAELEKAGLDAPSQANVLEAVLNSSKGFSGTKSTVSGNFNVLAILVKFSDNDSSSVSTLFDSLLFSTSGNTVRDYYSDISYGQLDLITVDLPSSAGWITAPQTYAYYVNNENGTSSFSYPNNCQKLTEDLVALVDPVVDFSNYDNNSDGYVDAVIVIHAGPGAEVTGNNTDIWSHKWNTKTPQSTGDGVYVYEYTIQPEYISVSGDMTIGVFCHELGHAFGLPDLYDIDGSSYGIGKWGIMAYGSWGGINGNLPTHPCAWSRIQMGFATATNVISNTNSQSIVDVKTNGDIYRLWSSGNIGSEYFLVENRQQTGYDASIPGNGLLIWHIDDAKASNTQEWWPGMLATQHYRVALEQADGLYEVEHTNDLGDANDPFLNGDEFNSVSPASSDSYTSGVSFVSVDNISGSAPTMLADFKVSLAAGIEDGFDYLIPNSIELYQNYPNPFNPSTEITFNLTQSDDVSVLIYNVLGQSVKLLLNDHLNAGTHSVSWDGRDESGNQVSSGIYFYKLIVEDDNEIKKMVLIK